MYSATMSNSTSLSEEASVSSGTRVQDFGCLNPVVISTISPQQPQKLKKKRSLPGNPDPDAEVIALSPKTLLATNRFVCEICNKGFQRDQNLQLHRRGHNLPWKLKQRNSKEIRKKAYVCPEPSCVHHHPSRALGDLTGIKKHYCRKHGEKKWKCEKCSKIYAVQSDWKAHSKTCGTREYRCDCGTLFSRKDSFITHRAFCDALAEESARLSANQIDITASTTTNKTPHSLHLTQTHHSSLFPNFPSHISLSPWDPPVNPNPNNNLNNNNRIKLEVPYHHHNFQIPPPAPSSVPFLQDFSINNNNNKGRSNLTISPYQNLHVTTQPKSSAATSSATLSATALLQKAATVGAATASGQAPTTQSVGHHHHMMTTSQQYLNVNMAEFGRRVDSAVSHVSAPEYHQLGGFIPEDLATWQKADSLTRDFLGLTGHEHHHQRNQDSIGNINATGNNNVNLSMNARNLLTYEGSVEFPMSYERDHHPSLLKPQGFRYAEPAAASQAWEC